MTQTLLQQWAQCQTILADNLTSSAYQTWFAPIVPLSYSEGVLVLQVKSQFVAEYIEENYIPLLSAAIIRVFGQGTRLEYRVLIDSASGAATMLPSTGAPERGNWQITNTQKPVTNEDLPKLNELYTFDSFIAGEPNKLGGSGVGKTHLACAIGHQAQALNPHARVLYVSANTFKLQFQDARKENRIPDFLNFYQSVDVLIVDDIQYFAGLKGTQDTFFHIFNYLQQSRKQLILTCDKPPVQLKDIEDRLLTRFKWGLAAEITPPDYALRKNILLSKMRRDGIVLSDEIVDFIAANVRDSVRDLEGILASLLAHSTLTDKEIDLPLAEKVVSHIVALQPQTISIEDVMDAVSKHYNVSEKAIMAQNRSRDISMARHVAVYLCKQMTDRSLTEIGYRMGRRTHATMLHSIAFVRDMMEHDAVLRQQIAQIEATIKH